MLPDEKHLSLKRSVKTPSAENTRDKVLESACLLFSKYGYKDTGIRDIAKKCKVNVATVLYHFQSKENLYMEVFYRAMDIDSALTIDHLLTRDPELLRTTEGKSFAIQEIVLDFFRRQLWSPIEWRRTLILREIIEQSPAYQRLVEQVLDFEVRHLEKLFSMVCPNASSEDALIWSRIPSSQSLFYLLAFPHMNKTFGKEYVESVYRKVAKNAAEMMIRKLDLPMPDLLK